jgi:hypothetical protein
VMDKSLLPIMSIASQQDRSLHIFAPELLLEPCFLLLRPVRECSHLLKRDPDEIEAPRSGKNAETVAEPGC